MTERAPVVRMSRKEREAEASLREWATITRDRDERVRAAVAAGVSKYRVNQLTGIGRSTIDRILGSDGPRTAPETGDRP